MRKFIVSKLSGVHPRVSRLQIQHDACKRIFSESGIIGSYKRSFPPFFPLLLSQYLTNL